MRVKLTGKTLLLRYLRGTLSMALCFKKSSAGFQGFVDAGLGGDMESCTVAAILAPTSPTKDGT